MIDWKDFRGNIAVCDDCMNLMKTLPDKAFELAICDPPYGININMNMGRKKGEPKKHAEKTWDNGIPSPEYFTELRRVSQNQIIWGGITSNYPLRRHGYTGTKRCRKALVLQAAS